MLVVNDLRAAVREIAGDLHVCPRGPLGSLVVGVDAPSCVDDDSAPGQNTSRAILSFKLGMANNDGPRINVVAKIMPHETTPSTTHAITRAIQTSFAELSFIGHL